MIRYQPIDVSAAREAMISKIDHDFARLQEFCREDEDIHRIVEILVSEPKEGSIERYVKSELSTFMWQISGMEINMRFPNVYWLPSLVSFIANYFYDDSYFDLEFGFDGVVKFKNAEDDEGRFLKNPRILLVAAEINAVYYKNFDDRDDPFEPRIHVDNRELLALIDKK